jgi:hypothetical protein
MSPFSYRTRLDISTLATVAAMQAAEIARKADLARLTVAYEQPQDAPMRPGTVRAIWYGAILAPLVVVSFFWPFPARAKPRPVCGDDIERLIHRPCAKPHMTPSIFLARAGSSAPVI